MLKLMALGITTVALTGMVVQGDARLGCFGTCGTEAAELAAAPAPEAAAPQGAGLRAFVDSHGNLTSTPPPGTRSAGLRTSGRPALVFSHYVDPNDPSKGVVYLPVNMRVASVATISADGKVTTTCTEGAVHPAGETACSEGHSH